MAKPSGTTGAFTVTAGPNGSASGAFAKRQWSATQKGIEHQILKPFVRETERLLGTPFGTVIMDVEDGGTSTLDFLLRSLDGLVYLELMEVVLPRPGEKPHQPGTHSFNVVEYANRVFAEVQKKITKYGFKHKTPIWLLLYVTHEGYNPSERVIEALQRIFFDEKHPFIAVSFLITGPEDFAQLRSLFRRDAPIVPRPRSLAELAEVRVINISSAELKVQRDENGMVYAGTVVKL